MRKTDESFGTATPSQVHNGANALRWEFAVASCWFHPEEEATVGALLDYLKANPGSTVTVSYGNGESYRCRFFSSYEADNENEVEDNPNVELVDYFAIALDPVEVIASGPHYDGPASLIELSYRDFPKRVMGEDGEVIYEA